MALSGGTNVGVGYVNTWDDDTGGVARDDASFSLQQRWVDGVGDGESDWAFSRKSDSFTGVLDIDLTAVETPGGVKEFAEITELYFANTGDAELEIGPAPSAGWDALFGDLQPVGAGGWMHAGNPGAAEPYAVSALAVSPTSKSLRVSCPVGTGAFRLLVRGRLAP